MPPIAQLIDTPTLTPTRAAVIVRDLAPAADNVRAEVLNGLRKRRKELPCKLLYDARGSELFDEICRLPEYYPTRTEIGILRRHGHAIADALGPRCLLVEYGSGSGVKTRILLDRLDRPAGYVPIDISRSALVASAEALVQRYPDLDMMPVCADYTSEIALPAKASGRRAARAAVFFPGSTIGNFHPADAHRFLRRLRRAFGPGSGLLIGVDLRKDPRVLHAAYNDSAGVTAAFNLNLLTRINRELAADFDPSRFAHYAFYNARVGRIEMHLVSLREQAVTVAGERCTFACGESIFTESSYKYSLSGFATLADAAGYDVGSVWKDPSSLFSVQHLVAR